MDKVNLEEEKKKAGSRPCLIFSHHANHSGSGNFQ